MINEIPLIRTRKSTIDFNKSNNSQCTGLVGSFEVVVLNSSAGRDLKCVYTSLGGRTVASFMAQGKTCRPTHAFLHSGVSSASGPSCDTVTKHKTTQDLNTRYGVPCWSHRAWKHTDRPTTLRILFDKSRDFISNMMSWLYYRRLVATQCRLSYQDSISRFLPRCASIHCIETCLTKHTILPCFKLLAH